VTASPSRWRTYGEVVDDAERAVVRSASGGNVPFNSDHDALAAAGAYARLRRVLARHVRLFVGQTRAKAHHSIALELAASLEAGSAHRQAARLEGRHPTAQAWSEAADLLGLAHDMLASHLDADRRPLTSEGELLLDPKAALPALGRTASVALAVEMGRGVVARAIENADPSQVSSAAAAACRAALADTGALRAASAMLDLAYQRSRPPGVEAIGLAPLAQPVATPDGTPAPADPLDRALHIVGGLRRYAYQQIRAGSALGPDGLRSYAALGADITGHAAIIVQATAQRAASLLGSADREQLSDLGVAHQALRAAGEGWSRVYRGWSDVVGVQPAPGLLHHQVRLARQSLHEATRHGAGWKTSQAMIPDPATALRYAVVARDLVAHLHPLAQHEHRIAERAQICEHLLVRTADTANEPHRPWRRQPAYAPLPYSSFNRIADAYQQAAQHSLTAATLLDTATAALGAHTQSPALRHVIQRALNSPQQNAAAAQLDLAPDLSL
jgi:hypothetical protein